MQLKARAHFAFAADDWLWSIFSDLWKDQYCARPRGHTPEQALAFLERLEITQRAYETFKAQYPKRTLVRVLGMVGRVIGHADDNRFTLHVRMLDGGRVYTDIAPNMCEVLQ